MIEQSLKKVLGFGVEEAIDKAFAGNWEPEYDFDIEYPYQRYVCDDGSIALTVEQGKVLGVHPIEKIVLDPKFWQAVGKTEGWESGCVGGFKIQVASDGVESCLCHSGKPIRQDGWRFKWVDFYDALAEEV